MTVKIKVLFGIMAAMSILAACSKEDAIFVDEGVLTEATTESVSVPEAVEVLTKSLTKEDLEGLSLFIKGGSTDESIYLDIVKDDNSLVKGEISRIEGDGYYKIFNLDLMVMNAIPVSGTVDALKLSAALARLGLGLFSDELTESNLSKANACIDVTVMMLYKLELAVIEDPDNGRKKLDAVIVDPSNPDSATISITELIALFS